MFEAEFKKGVLISQKSANVPNLKKRRRKLWLRQNPVGSVGRIQWEERKALASGFARAMNSGD